MSEAIEKNEVKGKKSKEDILLEARKQLDEIVGLSSKGKLALSKPLRSDGEIVNELVFDFEALTAWEYVDAVDNAGGKKPDAYHVNGRQALALFAAAAAKQTPHVDDKDIIDRLSPQDAIAAIQVATVFFNASSRAGSMRTTKT